MYPTISCPGCEASLKKPAALPAGKRIQCPHCGTTFAPATDSDAPLGVTTALQPAVEASPAVDAPPRRTASAGNKDSAPPKRFSTGAVLALVALLVVFLLGGTALAVLAYFGSAWYAPSRSNDGSAAVQQPMPPGPVGPGPVGPGAVRPGPVAPAPQPPQVSPKIGETAPEIEGKDLDDKPMKLSDFRGKVVVLDFWGDWCPFCKAAYTYQRQLMQRMKGRSFVLVGVNCDQTIEKARLVVKNQRIGWRSWWDGTPEMTGPIYKRWGVQSVPSVFVLDTRGVVRAHFDAAPPAVELEALVESLLPAAERGKPHWFAADALLAQLGAETSIGAYQIRLPKDFVAAKREPQEGAQTFLWKHSTILNGATQLEVTLRPAGQDKVEESIEKALTEVPCLRQGWGCTRAQRGEVNGTIFQRVIWSGIERGGKRPMSGFVYVALDGDVLIQIAARTTETNPASLSLADAAALTLRKAAK